MKQYKMVCDTCGEKIAKYKLIFRVLGGEEVTFECEECYGKRKKIKEVRRNEK